jgi:tRNA 2-thiouridine synthesizing protein A
MSNTVDAHGLSCPQPVSLARQAITAARFPIEVLVDTVTPRENVRRMAEGAGCKVQIEPVAGEFKLTITR